MHSTSVHRLIKRKYQTAPRPSSRSSFHQHSLTRKISPRTSAYIPLRGRDAVMMWRQSIGALHMPFRLLKKSQDAALHYCINKNIFYNKKNSDGWLLFGQKTGNLPLSKRFCPFLKTINLGFRKKMSYRRCKTACLKRQISREGAFLRVRC